MSTNPLYNKIVYAFGDSIVYGHTAPEASFMHLIADECGINLTMYAKNGATVIPGSGNDIITQIENASFVAPDIVVFNGYTNDAYDNVLQKLGTPQGPDTTVFDSKTFSGAFEEIIYTIKEKWQNAKILYVTTHKSAARDWNIQCTLHQLTTSICHKWAIPVADVFTKAALDTRDSIQMNTYIIGGSGSHPNEKACLEFYIPLITDKLI